jgi:hypothetical protein
MKSMLPCKINYYSWGEGQWTPYGIGIHSFYIAPASIKIIDRLPLKFA